MRRRVLTICALAAFLLAACGSGSGSGSSQGGTLTVAVGSDADTLDPAAQTTTIVGQMVGMAVEPLVQVNRSGKTVPDLATSWSESAGGTVYTFNLRHNVKFSDGEAFNAAAVVKSLDRLNAPSTFSAEPGNLAVIQSITAVSDYQVRFQLKEAFSPFVANLTSTTAGVLAPDSFTEHGNTIDKVVWPVGTGPYVYTGRVTGEQLSFARNKHYWGKKPAYANQVYKVVPNAASREALVKSGQAQVINEPPPNDLPALEKSSEVKTILGPDIRMVGIYINVDDPRVPQLSNVLVRQALNDAVDKNAIIQKIEFGAAKPLKNPVTSSVFGYCDATGTNSYAYNPTKAKQLLQQAGATNLTVTLGSPNGHYPGDYAAAQAVAADLQAVGLHVTVPNPPTWPSYVAEVDVPPSTSTVDMAVLGWENTMDASGNLEPFEQSQIPPAGLNTSGWYNAQSDQLIQQAETATSSATAKSDYCAAEKIIWNAAPWIWLFEPDNPVVTTTTVKNIEALPNEEFITAFAQPAS